MKKSIKDMLYEAAGVALASLLEHDDPETWDLDKEVEVHVYMNGESTYLFTFDPDAVLKYYEYYKGIKK